MHQGVLHIFLYAECTKDDIVQGGQLCWPAGHIDSFRELLWASQHPPPRAQSPHTLQLLLTTTTTRAQQQLST